MASGGEPQVRIIILSALPILIIFTVLFFALKKRPEVSRAATKNLKVLTYAAFLNAWGPGPIIAKKFQEQSGIQIEFIDAGDAGLLLKKLALFKADVVLGLDQFGIAQRDPNIKWQSRFQAIDWSPMTFIYRKGEIDPPKNLDDLLDARFENKISLSDPRTSTPGLQFLLWILREKGRDQGFKFLKKLKKNIAFVGPSWSSSYGHFKKKQSQLVFSYFTSPVYHWTEENNFSYQAAVLKEKMPIQVEFAVISAGAENLENAKGFMSFLMEEETQKVIMKKNFMLPIKKESARQSPFERLSLSYVIESEMQGEKNPTEAELSQLFAEWQAIGI